LKWIFQKFRNINEAIIELKGSIHREIININFPFQTLVQNRQ
jgi:hypothetical protein